MPGFIDVHSHLTLEPDENYYRKTLNELMRTPTEMAFYAAANARRTLEAGFTTVRHVGGRQFLAVALRNAIAPHPPEGPPTLVARTSINQPGRACVRPPSPHHLHTPPTP